MAYMLRSARYLSHDVLKEAVQKGDTVIDATMGNGHDTLFLCELVGEEGQVIAFAEKDSVKCIVFNLGWLPGGDKSITTLWETTKVALEKALSLLKKHGVLLLCAYPGHAEGDRERSEVKDFLASLAPQQYNVLHQKFLNAGPGAPENFIIQKQ